MLHILWLILKFILIILGILLGLLLLAVLLVLFCPVRYKASAVKTEGDWKQIEGEGVVSWLFHGISLKAEWKNQQMEMSFHLFGIPVDKLLKKRQKKKSDSEKVKNASKKSEIKKSGSEASQKSGSEATKSKNEKHESEAKLLNDSADQGANSTENHTEINENEESIKQNQHKPDNESENTETVINEKETQSEDTASEESLEGALEQKTFFIKRIYDRIRNTFKGIRAKLQNVRRTLRKIKNNLSWWKAFLGHPRVKAARTLVWKHAKFLLKHIFPTKIEGQVAFSFEDPALTGAALAIFGMTIPFHKNCVQINPCFDGENYLQGNIRVKGRIYGFVFLRAALIIYFDKNIKYVIKRWKTRRA